MSAMNFSITIYFHSRIKRLSISSMFSYNVFKIFSRTCDVPDHQTYINFCIHSVHSCGTVSWSHQHLTLYAFIRKMKRIFNSYLHVACFLGIRRCETNNHTPFTIYSQLRYIYILSSISRFMLYFTYVIIFTNFIFISLLIFKVRYYVSKYLISFIFIFYKRYIIM